jgi:hypothetical protein
MTILIRDTGGTQRTISAIQVRDGTNTARDISEIWVRDGNNVPRLVFSLSPPMTLACFPTTASGHSSGSGTCTTGTTTATPTGGTGPYSYLWTCTEYDNPTPPTIGSDTSATTDFTQTGTPLNSVNTATFECVVTDSLGATATAGVAAVFSNYK